MSRNFTCFANQPASHIYSTTIDYICMPISILVCILQIPKSSGAHEDYILLSLRPDYYMYLFTFSIWGTIMCAECSKFTSEALLILLRCCLSQSRCSINTTESS